MSCAVLARLNFELPTDQYLTIFISPKASQFWVFSLPCISLSFSLFHSLTHSLSLLLSLSFSLSLCFCCRRVRPGCEQVNGRRINFLARKKVISFLLHQMQIVERMRINKSPKMAVVVAQLAERLLPTPDIRSSNPDIGNEIFWTYLSVNCYPEKTKIKKNRPGMAHLKEV